MIKKLTHLKEGLIGFSFLLGSLVSAQTYYWTGATNNDFYTASNWYSSSVVDFSSATKDAAIVMSGAGTYGNSPIINTDLSSTWYPLIFNHSDGTIVINKPFLTHFNDYMNGTMEVNSGGIFQALQIARVGGNNSVGTVNVNNGGVYRALDTTQANWQGIFIGASQNGTGTMNVNDGGYVDGGYNLEVGTRDFYPTGTLNIAKGGTAQSYWATWIGPNGTVNLNGGNLNTGQSLSVGELFLDNASNAGTLGAVVGSLNINSGTVTVNQFDLDAPSLLMNSKAKIIIDSGVLRIKKTGVNQSSVIYPYIVSGQIAPATGKKLSINYDGTYTTVSTSSLATVENQANTLNIYPNPVKDVVYLSSTVPFTANSELKIFDIEGKLVYRKNISTGFNKELQINVENLEKGIYILSASTQNGYVNKKFVKN